MMDDIEPEDNNSPEIIHVVNYSEAVCLATPPIIKESIQITLYTLAQYRLARSRGLVYNMKYDTEVHKRATNLYEEAKNAIELLEAGIPNLYTPEGFALIFEEGFLPVPYLMDPYNSFPKATKYQTSLKDGGVYVIDEEGERVNTIERYKKIFSQMI